MGYQVTGDFRGGLDTRKYKLNLPPGTLTQLVNGHISQGAEIEKRKAYVPTAVPSLTFGGQETTAGIVIFGSRDMLGWNVTSTLATGSGQSGQYRFTFDATTHTPPAAGDPITVTGSLVAGANGNWTILSSTFSSGTTWIVTVSAPGATGVNFADTGTAVPRLDSPVIYQKLVHPFGSPNMTGITASTYYNGKTACVATWDNGDALVYYGADVLKDFYVGIGQVSQSELTPYAMANDLCDALTATGRYTTVKPTLGKLYMVVTAGAVAGDKFTVTYNLNRGVTWGDGSSSNPGLAQALNIPFNTSLNQTATDIATAIAASLTPNGNNAGFTAVTGTVAAGVFTAGAGNAVQVTSPFGLNDLDSISIGLTGNAAAYTPPSSAVFDVLSIPNQASASPYTPNVDVANGSLAFQLVSSGATAVAPTNAQGQLSIYAGSSNKQATGSIAYTANNPALGSTITVGSVTYTFVNALTNGNYLVLIGSTPAETLANLIAAINAGSGLGTVYSTNVLNPNAGASAIVAGATTLTANVGGTPGNALALAQSAAFFTLTAFAGGGPNTNGISQISVGGVNLLPSAVQFNQTNAQTASDLVAAINANTGTSGFSAVSSGSIVSLVAAAGGTSANFARVVVTTTGNVCIANCSFVVTAVAAQNISVITGSLSGTGGFAANMLTATITYQDGGHPTETLAQFCGRVAANVNANATAGYAACAVGNSIFISRLTIASDDPPENIQVTSTASVSSGTSSAMTVAVSLGTVTFNRTIQGGFTLYSNSEPQSVILTPTGGVPPYSYAWQPVPAFKSTDGNYNVSVASNITDSTINYQWWSITGTFKGSQLYNTGGGPFTGALTGVVQALCVVTDSSNPPQTVDVTVNLNIPY